MKIWLLRLNVDKYNSFDGYKVEKNLNINFFGNSVAEKWNPPLLEAYYKKRKIADISDFSCGAPVFNEKAVEVLKDFLDGNAEILLSHYENSKYYVINVVNVIEALDNDKTQFRMFSTGEKSVECEKYVFKEQVVEGQNIFKIPLGNSIMIFVGDKFKKCVEDTSLKGFIFIEVWDSDEITIQDKLESKTKDIKPEATNLKLKDETINKNVKEVYPVISELEAKNLQVKIIGNLFDVVVEHVKEIAINKGKIDSIGLAYFFDGQYTDIGLSVNVLLDSTEDEYEEVYLKLLDHPNITFDFNSLFRHYVKGYMNEDETSAFWGIIQEIIFKLNEKIQNTVWQNITEVTKDFCIETPELCD